MATVPLPQFTDGVDLRYFIEPLSAAAHPTSYLDRFPAALYNKAPDSHFIRFMYTLLGPVGIGWLKQNIAEARLQLEASGAQLFDLERFYGDPFSFGRILTESFDNDVSGLLSSAKWDTIRAQDEAYRSRAIQFLNAARLGGTPEGMRLAASSGAGQNVEIVENYRFFFDQHDDDPFGLTYYGSSNATGEFIVVPRASISLSELQTIRFDLAPPLGTFPLFFIFNGYSTPAFDIGVGTTAPAIQMALEALPTVGLGNVIVSGGPVPAAVNVTFAGTLANRTLPTLRAQFTNDHGLVKIPVIVTTGDGDPSSETVPIGDLERHEIQTALDYLRPVGTYPTFYASASTVRPRAWASVAASTEAIQVTRFVTGNSGVSWPSVDTTHWIEPSIENEAPILQSSATQHYVGFHNATSVTAYSDTALADSAYVTNSAILSQYNSVHVGAFPEMSPVMPFFDAFTEPLDVFSADRALAAYPEPLTIAVQATNGLAFVNGIYPADYVNLQGVPSLVYHDDHFWSSRSRPDGAEILEIDLGAPQAVNFIALEVTRKPISIAIDYDLSDQAPTRHFAPVSFVPGFPLDTTLFYDPSQQSAWEPLQFYFTDSLSLIFTRFIRLTFTRRPDDTTYGRFLYDTVQQVQTPWSIDVRNLRIGRNISPTVD